ncbi:D12 class N6 adenine-specific DNA methyltransferase [[Clostridium] scindens ATCC 35704]|nr:DNA adenine methylase [[Clostridium] scindens]EDS08260.1 D12 class N6 adenine-specific DNA methyltransferase [[Clostridium] scindens ATCC 35704]QRO38677.1 DNA adenine methylase [[Clostridium] scindens]
MKAIMKYPGSKWGTAEWIISHFPEHHSYLEPFFGSGGVFFNKPRSDIETINDLDGDVVNLFRWIKDDPERLTHEIYFTPYSREVYEEAYQKEPESSLEKAVLFYVRLNMGHGFRTTGEKVGWKVDIQGREKAYAAADWCQIPEKIMEAAERLRGVQIENRPAVEVIRRYNFENVLIYCDPPYVLSTRCRKQYNHEMSDEDHEELLEALLQHKGPVVISGYSSPLYEAKLGGWFREERTNYAQNAQQRREIIWYNRQAPGQQLTLF